MLNAGNPIGVMDSGIGGLTVVRELQRILPGEDIIYFGDSANCPYGNKTSDQIFELSSHMLQFLGDNGVKCTAIACNTISTMADRLRPCFDYKIVSIVEEAAKYVLREHERDQDTLYLQRCGEGTSRSFHRSSPKRTVGNPCRGLGGRRTVVNLFLYSYG